MNEKKKRKEKRIDGRREEKFVEVNRNHFFRF